MIDTNKFKESLLKELELVESELKTVGVHDPENPSDWEAVPPPASDVLGGDEHEAADRMETYEENAGIVKQLEIRYNEIRKALKKIEDGTYGVCEVSGEPIEVERLEANPAATTCMKHMK
ncbi:MAG: TraR/DksA C4-type zinc finger protein [Candidatus Paceibacterota bacterium]